MQVAIILFLVYISIKLLIEAYKFASEAMSDFYNFWFVDFIYGTLFICLCGVALMYALYIKNKKDAEKNKKEAEAERVRLNKLRDSDIQSEPYTYQIGRHGNQTLAIRYGIVNTKRITVPYFYYAKGGVKKRNPDRDKTRIVDANLITLRKLGRLQGEKNMYLVELKDFKNKKAIAIHIKGDEFIKTFYPINHGKNGVDTQWWRRHPELERALKDNKSFTLKDMARFHVDKTVPTPLQQTQHLINYD